MRAIEAGKGKLRRMLLKIGNWRRFGMILRCLILGSMAVRLLLSLMHRKRIG